jgi:hypothetical protein
MTRMIPLSAPAPNQRPKISDPLRRDMIVAAAARMRP